MQKIKFMRKLKPGEHAAINRRESFCTKCGALKEMLTCYNQRVCPNRCVYRALQRLEHPKGDE